LQLLSGLVVADNPEQPGSTAQGRYIQGNVTRATGTILAIIDLDYWNRSLRGYACGATMPVAVQHDVSDNQQSGILEWWHFQFHVCSPVLGNAGSAE
jgi:hypothetical protein